MANARTYFRFTKVQIVTHTCCVKLGTDVTSDGGEQKGARQASDARPGRLDRDASPGRPGRKRRDGA